MPLLDTPFAQLDLIRQPEQQDEPLQAFDAADEYLLNHVAGQGLTLQSKVLVLNDSFMAGRSRPAEKPGAQWHAIRCGNAGSSKRACQRPF
jgi:hypothetical protein